MSFERQANTTMVVVKGLHSIEEPTFAELAKSLRTLSASTLRGPMDIEGSTLFFVGPADSMFEQTVKAIQVGKIAQRQAERHRDRRTADLAEGGVFNRRRRCEGQIKARGSGPLRQTESSRSA